MLPPNFMSWNRALRGAFLKGASAFLGGELIGECPYQDKRKNDGRLTWSRSFSAAWRDGWQYAEKYRDDALITVAYYYKRKTS